MLFLKPDLGQRKLFLQFVDDPLIRKKPLADDEKPEVEEKEPEKGENNFIFCSSGCKTFLRMKFVSPYYPLR